MKTVEGWLCRDKCGALWFAANRIPRLDEDGVWQPGPNDSDEWYDAEVFCADYDLTDNGKPCALPKPGRKFLVDMEL